MKCRTLNCVHSNVDDSVQVIKTICKSVNKKQQWHEFATGAQHWNPRQYWILDFHAVDSGFQVLDSSLCQWNLDSGFQSLVGFRIPRAVFWARSIQPKFWPVRPGKVVHLKRWTCFFETFPVGQNRSIEFWTEISGNFGWMDRTPGFHMQNFPGFRIPRATITRIPESTDCSKWSEIVR